MINKPISYIVINDVHLGHRNNSTKDIIANLDIFFNNYAFRKDKLDILFIAGDLFDDLLDLSSTHIYTIIAWMNRLVNYCSTNKIKLRVLEGTPSHDRLQSSLFETTISISNSDIDFKYIRELDIEIMPDYNLSILYVPDEWNRDTSVTYKEARTAMEAHGLLKVDLAIMHGQFEYQLPMASMKAPRHSEALYLDMVEHYIHIGHIHQFTTYSRIIAGGSFDRLSHGDEIPKGGIYAIIRPNGDDEFIFVENKLAKKYITLLVKDIEIDDVFNYLDKKLLKIPVGSFIRIRAKKNTAVFKNIDLVKRRYINYNISKIGSDDEESSKSLTNDLLISTYIPIIIRKDNISELLLDNILPKYVLSVEELSNLKNQLAEVI
jgi:DNA repair exonuclease SbcCD nuclease subunit